MRNISLAKEDEIAIELKKIPLWERKDKEIQREFVFQNFVAAIGFVNAVAILAEKADHHPDINIYGWNKVRITISTHDKGGLTNLDFQLAISIDSLEYR